MINASGGSIIFKLMVFCETVTLNSKVHMFLSFCRVVLKNATMNFIRHPVDDIHFKPKLLNLFSSCKLK